MFDFDRWCSWAEAECRNLPDEGVLIEFRRGQPSPKPGASIAFTTDRDLMLFQFWQTGESDFHGLERKSLRGTIVFTGRLVDDSSFEQTFRECLSWMA